MATIGELSVKDAVTCQQDMLRTIKNGMTQLGVTNPDVGPTTDYYLTTRALANELTAVGYNAVLRNDDQMPDTAQGLDQGDGLLRIGGLFDKAPQPAAPSVGPVIMDSSAAAPVPTGAQLTDSLSQRYEVVTGGTFASGASITIRALTGGASTNHAEDDVLQWADSIPFANSNALVGPGGLINGTDADTQEVFRARVLEVFQAPPANLNWSDVVELTEASTSSVAKGFAFPAVQGPSTYDIAATAAPTATNKSRALTNVTLTSVVIPYVLGKVTAGAFGTITTVEDVPTDIAMILVIPDAPTASPPGTGGGWNDGTPWPRPNGTTKFVCTVTGVTSSTVFTVDADDAPTPSVSTIAWLNPFGNDDTSWTIFQATVLSVTGTAGAYTITIDQPFPAIANGCFIWPGCANAQVYIDAIIDAYAAMGPGEKTTNVSALVRGFRHPPTAIGWAASLGSGLTHAVEQSADEVQSAQFFYRFDSQASVSLNGATGLLTPTVPAAYAPPRQYIPRHIGLYRQPS